MRHYQKLVTLALFSATAVALPFEQGSGNAAPPAQTSSPAKEWPDGNKVTEASLRTLAEGRLFTGQLLYLVGTFIVTARSDHRVVMRFDSNPKGVRVMADYPTAVPPPEGAKVIYEDAGKLLITDIRLGRDRQITVYVRELARP